MCTKKFMGMVWRNGLSFNNAREQFCYKHKLTSERVKCINAAVKKKNRPKTKEKIYI